MIRALVVDDHAVVREGLKRILNGAGDIVVEGEAANGMEALNQVRRHSYDVVVTDISMPGRGGVEFLKDVKRERPRLPVLVLSIHAEDQLAIRALKAGAGGYLTKEGAPAELVTAVRHVAKGGRYVSTALAERLAAHVGGGSDEAPHERLSDREFQVMKLMGAGRTATEIAEMLALSVKTVSTYRTRMLEKMGMRTSAEVIAYAIKNELTEH